MPVPTSTPKPTMRSNNQKMPSKLRLKLANECAKISDKAKLNPSNKSYGYHLLHSNQVDSLTYDRLSSLFELLMRSMYEQSSWGWNEKEKLGEWKHSRSRFIIVTKCQEGGDTFEFTDGQSIDKKDEIIAFMCYRFETGADKNEAAIYVYELHVDQAYQRQGLGEDLMKMAKILGIAFKMDKIMLTVFRSNGQALQFYNKLNFKPDKSSPGKEEADYIILSNKL